MKLELKHLAPYLPYGLKYVKYSDNNSPIRHDIMQGVSTNGIYACGDITPLYFKNCKPILRPLSDLTKEIEVNGNLFIPNHHPLFKIFINDDMDWFMDNCPFFVNYVQVQKLLEWHFDVFNLIEKGLAIDINTL